MRGSKERGEGYEKITPPNPEDTRMRIPGPADAPRPREYSHHSVGNH